MYKAPLLGDFEEISQDRFVYLNTKLSVLYYKSSNLKQKRQILDLLYKLDLPMFKVWKLWQSEDRQDFEQDAFIYLHRALETFNPSKGAFVSWLKLYILTAHSEYASSKPPKTDSVIPDSVDTDPTAADSDALLWRRVRAVLTAEEWQLVTLRVLGGMTVADVSASLQRPLLETSRRLQAVFLRIRAELGTLDLPVTPRLPHVGKTKGKSAPPLPSPSILGELDGGSKTFSLSLTASLTGLSRRYLHELATGQNPTRHFHPHDVTPSRPFRFRVLMRNGARIYPRILARTDAPQPPP